LYCSIFSLDHLIPMDSYLTLALALLP
jgi:hypothetical protein